MCSDTKPSQKISEIITNKRFCKDVQKLSNSYQKSQLEVFHSTIIEFAPKKTAFSYLGMKSRQWIRSNNQSNDHDTPFDNRLQLAAIHYNHNSSKKQAVTKSGEKRWSILYPKYKQKGHIVRRLMEKSNFG